MENERERFDIEPVSSPCPICGRIKKLWAHHITYSPEKIIYICRQCHSVIHWINFIGMDKLNTLISWVLIHGDSWKNGNLQYQRSNHKKAVNHLWAVKNRAKRSKQARIRYASDPEKHRNYIRQYRKRLKERMVANG